MIDLSAIKVMRLTCFLCSRLPRQKQTKKGHPMGDPFPFVGGGGENGTFAYRHFTEAIVTAVVSTATHISTNMQVVPGPLSK